MTMGERILKLRKAHGWSQEELAERIGVSRQAISRWESDQAKPDADNIISLCEQFGVSADYLLGTGMTLDNPAPSVAVVNTHGLNRRLLIGIVLLVLGILSLLTLGVISALDPWMYSANGITYDGVMGYVLAHDMQWFVLLTAALCCGGIVTVCVDVAQSFRKNNL